MENKEVKNKCNFESESIGLLSAKLDIASMALITISMGTEDSHPPYRDLPPSRLKCIATEAIEKMKSLNK